MWMLPLYLHVNQKSDYDMMTKQTTTVVIGSLRVNTIAKI